MVKEKKKSWKRASFSISTQVLHILDSVPRNVIPNKSKFMESLIVGWLKDNKYITSGSL